MEQRVLYQFFCDPWTGVAQNLATYRLSQPTPNQSPPGAIRTKPLPTSPKASELQSQRCSPPQRTEHQRTLSPHPAQASFGSLCHNHRSVFCTSATCISQPTKIQLYAYNRSSLTCKTKKADLASSA